MLRQALHTRQESFEKMLPLASVISFDFTFSCFGSRSKRQDKKYTKKQSPDTANKRTSVCCVGPDDQAGNISLSLWCQNIPFIPPNLVFGVFRMHHLGSIGRLGYGRSVPEVTGALWCFGMTGGCRYNQTLGGGSHVRQSRCVQVSSTVQSSQID